MALNVQRAHRRHRPEFAKSRRPESKSTLQTYIKVYTPSFKWTGWVYTPSFKWTGWLVFQIMIRNYHFQSFWPLVGAKLCQWGPNALNIHPTSVFIRFEMEWVISFPENGRKPAFSVICLPLEGWNWVNITQKWINSEHLLSKCIQRSIFLPPEGQNWVNMAQGKSILNTYPAGVYIKFEMS